VVAFIQHRIGFQALNGLQHFISDEPDIQRDPVSVAVCPFQVRGKLRAEDAGVAAVVGWGIVSTRPAAVIVETIGAEEQTAVAPVLISAFFKGSDRFPNPKAWEAVQVVASLI
jgi:hypothetical protein